MASELPPDPYAALGVPKDADSSAIKSKYRKLVLTCHPDKVVGDEELKRQKTEEFHKIQQAYDILGDENKRATHDAEVRLAQLKKERQARGGPNVEVRSAKYETRTAEPGGATYTSRTQPRFEERRPSTKYSDEERYFDDRSSARKYSHDDYTRRSSQKSSRPEKEPVKPTRVTADRTRSDAKKSRDRDERRDRAGKYVYIDDDSDSDEKARYEDGYKRRSDEARYKADAEEVRKAADARRKEDSRRSSDDAVPRRHRSHDDYYPGEREKKLHDLEANLKHYTSRAKDEAVRPSPSRAGSTRDYFVRPSKHDRPEAVRRSSARPKDRENQPISSARDRIVDWDRSPPSFKQTTSSPSDIKTVPRAAAQRSYTTEGGRDRAETSPTPIFRRSETMPTVNTTTRTTAPPRSSTLRNAESAAPPDSGYSSPSTPENTYPSIPGTQTSSTKKLYHYPTSGGGVALSSDDVKFANGHRTILREPERHRHRSPSPLGRPPIGANRTASNTSTPLYVPAPAPPKTTPLTRPPVLGRAATMHHSPDRRGSERSRGDMLYGEVPSGYSRSSRRDQPSGYRDSNVQYAKKYGPDDVRWSRGRETEERPGMSRNPTYVY